MKNGLNMNEEQTKQVEKNIDQQMEQFPLGQDLVTDYKRYRNYISKNHIEEYFVKRRSIEIGKELMPLDNQNLDEEEKKEIKEIYKKAKLALKSQIPKKRSIKKGYFNDGKQKYPIFKFTAGDAEECQADTEIYDKVEANFTVQQHEQHIGDLAEVDNDIFHILVKYGIIKKEDPTIKQLREKKKKERLKKRDKKGA